MFSESDENAKNALEEEVVAKWQKFSANGGMVYDQPLVEVSAIK